MRKKHLAFFLAFILGCTLLAVPASADGAVLRVTPPDSYPKVGESFEVTVELEGNPGFYVFYQILGFDTSAMRCTGIEAGTMLQDTQYDYNAERSEGLSIAAINMAPVTGDGVLAVYSFVALRDIEEWSFSIIECGLGDENGDDIPLSAVQAQTGSAVTTTVPPAATVTPAPEDDRTGSSQTKPDMPAPTDDRPDSIPEKQVPPTPAPSDTPAPAEDRTGGTPSETEGTKEAEEEVAILFSDTAGHWGEEYISDAVRLGLFQGYSEDLFGPDDPVTRGQFVTVLYRLAGKPQTGEASTFEDISDQLPEFQAAIAWAAGQGFVNGRSAAEFDPNGRITRQEAMKILFAYSGGVSGMEAMLTSIYDAEYTDSAEIASWAKSAIYWGVYNRLISGTGEMTLSPQGTATRAQLAKILVSYVNL